MRASAEATAALLGERGFENVQLLEIEGAHPYVYGEILQSAGQADAAALRAPRRAAGGRRARRGRAPPFEPTERDGRLYGRGAADDKAGIVVHTVAVDAWLKGAGALPLNVKIIVEGEEEIGSGHLERVPARSTPRCCTPTPSSSPTPATSRPGCRRSPPRCAAWSPCDVEVRALKQSLHSGMWGGPVPDPVMALCRCSPRSPTPTARVAIPGITRRCGRSPTRSERASPRSRTDEAKFREQAGLLPGVQLLGGGRTRGR